MADTQWQFNSHSDSQDIVSFILDKAEATVGTFPLKRITRNFNAKMDLYCAWAFEIDGRWSFDDVTQTNPPIDTQNIASGTNRYKFSAFTQKIIRLIKLEALDSSGNGIELKREFFNELGSPLYDSGDSSKTFEELYIQAPSGAPAYYTLFGDFIYLRNNPNYTKASGLVAYFNRAATYLASSATTTVPGIIPIHIPLVAEMAANEWKVDKGKMRLGDKLAFESYVKGIVQEHFANRGEETRQVFRTRIKSFI